MENTSLDERLPERLLKAQEVAEILNISKAFAYHLIRQGKIRSVAIEGARRVRPEDLRLYIEENLTPYRLF
jgi:excisionase family DNA binding protein